MNETSLHTAIKSWYSLPGDKLEFVVDGFIIDIVRGNLLIEVQTRNFSSIRDKLKKLIGKHKVRLVHPIAKRKWIVYVRDSGAIISKRRSPKKGKLLDLLYELVSIPDLMKSRNFSIEILLTEEEELRCRDGRGSWRRKGVSIKDRRLLGVTDRFLFNEKEDFLMLLPVDLPEPFTNKSLAKAAGISVGLAQKLTYCLKKADVITEIGKKRKALIFEKN